MIVFVFAPYFVDRDIRIVAVHGSESETALLKLGLWIVPFLVDDEMLETRKEAYFSKHATIFLREKNQIRFEMTFKFLIAKSE